MEENKETKLFAFIVDGDVVHTMNVPDEPALNKLIAGLQSDPKVIDVTHMPDIKTTPNWKYNYDTKEFYQDTLDNPNRLVLIEDVDDYEVE